MYLFLALLASTTTTTKPSSSSATSSATSLILIVLIGAAAYFLFIRPRSMAQRRQRETMQELVPGDEVLTGAGIFGTVLDVASDRITIETAPGTRLTVLRSTIARRITPEPETPEEAWSEHPEGEHGDQPPASLGWAAEDGDGHDGPHGAEEDEGDEGRVEGGAG